MDRQAVVQCQHCRTQLMISPSDSISEPFDTLPPRLDESFMLLEKTLGGRIDTGSGGGHPEKMEESFILLQDNKSQFNQRSQLTNDPDHIRVQQRFSLDDHMNTLANIMDLASEATSIDQPLCPDCTLEVQRDLEQQIKDLEAELSAYTALKNSLEAASAAGELTPMDDKQFQKELKKAQEEVKLEESKLAKAKTDLSTAESRLRIATNTTARLASLEEQYWHAFNTVMLAVRCTADYRDSLQHRIHKTERSLVSLRRTNVLADIFYIWKDGPFGTISGLRLGNVSASPPVEWWEINAAWGQAVLLLDTLARAVGHKFTQHRVEPFGSFPKIHDGRGSHELFGPVSKIVCISYDRAQVGYLACLKDFAEALASRGTLEDGRPFCLKYAIEGDKIGGVSIRYGLSRDKAWTRALKYMLLNLKYCLKGALSLLDRRALMAVAALPREGPSAAMMTQGGG